MNMQIELVLEGVVTDSFLKTDHECNECVVLCQLLGTRYLSLGLVNIRRQVEQSLLLCSYKLAQVS